MNAQFLLTDSIQRTFALATLICGSLAYDNIMTFQGRFGDHILPDQVHMLNISFLVPTMRRNFGGCAGNIAYALKLLGGDAKIMATLGEADAQLYLDRLDALGLSKEYVRVLPDQHSAQCFITTDLANNQITAFHPGAMMESHLNRAGRDERHHARHRRARRRRRHAPARGAVRFGGRAVRVRSGSGPADSRRCGASSHD